MSIRYVDLFCGIGGFRYAAERALRSRDLIGECVFSCDIDRDAQNAYEANFGERPHGDITLIHEHDVPDHDLLFAGFPCQPFSIIGESKGFEDARGALFFDIARILRAKRPTAFVLENVKQLAGHDEGRTLSRILETLDGLGYHHSHRILNARHFGLPQKRERIIIVGFRDPASIAWPLAPVAMKPLKDILESDVPRQYYASERIRKRRLEKCQRTDEPTIWHENKGGHISAYPFSCALRAGASYNYLLVNGERRLTPREMLRLQGFPDSFIITGNYSTIRKQAGNAVPVPMVQAVIERVLDAIAGFISQEDLPPCRSQDLELSKR
ncbi:MAG: DNA (cytosine-5-)-methyltransferase [Armatimonadota bacterium]|nr:DNA (cytosine-5-)-methyltransferase [Armatimonadota bacterium]